MKKVIQTIPRPSSYTYNATDKRIYTRFHRNPQTYQTSFRSNKTYKINTTVLEEESVNNFISNIYKEKKYRGFLDPTAPNNKNIFVETDSDYQKTDSYPDGFQRKPKKKSTQLLIAKTESQFPETYNTQNVFRKNELVTGYYIKVNKNKNTQLNNKYNTLTNQRMIKTFIQTPSAESDGKIIYDYNKGSQTQIRQKKLVNMKYLNQTYNRNYSNKEFLRKDIDLNECPSVEKSQKITYRNNYDLQNCEKELKTDNSNETENQNVVQNQSQNQIINQNQKLKYPVGMVYTKRKLSDKNPSYSKSNISEISEDIINKYKRQQMDQNENKNYLAGNASETASPKEYKIINDMAGTSEEESEKQAELIFYNKNDYQNYMNKKIIRTDVFNNNIIDNDKGGKVDLYYGIMNNKKDIGIKSKALIIKKKITVVSIEEIIKKDIYKMNLLIRLQRFIKSYLYLRELCAMKIQAVWRGGNTRKIMDLYNDLDEFIYHLSKVQFNHFNNDFCFFIKQLFNIYKANLSNGKKENENNDNENENENEEENENNEEEEENEDENENCMEQISLEEIEQKEDIGGYSYKFPDGAFFDHEKLAAENEIDLFVKGSPRSYGDKKFGKKSKEYEKLKRDYDELNQQYNELKQKSNSNNNIIIKHIIHRKDKNESASTIGSNKSEYKFRKIEKFNTHSRDNSKNNKAFSDKRYSSSGDNGKNLTFSNDYDADLDINRDDDFFNQDMSYDDKDNSGSLIKDKKFSYFSIHSDENSKYFDNENPKEREREIREGDIYKINISKNSGGSKINSSKYTRSSSRQGQSKLYGLHRYDKSSKNNSQSPSIEKSNNYMGHHSKTFPRKYKNYNEQDNNILIIPKHEEDFHILNTNMFLSPKDREEHKHIKNVRSDIAITPNIKFEDKNWNEIIEFIKNEEIEIPTQKNIKLKNQSKIQPKETKEISTEITPELYLYENKPITNEQFYFNKTIKEKMPYVLENNVAKINILKKKVYKKPRKFLVRKNEEINFEGIEKNNKMFNILEKENNNEINIDNKDYMNKKLSKILVQHENELNIGKDKKEIMKEKSLIKEIENKNNEISLLKKELEEIKNKMNKPKIFEAKLEINKKLNSFNIDGIKPKYNEVLLKSEKTISEEELKKDNQIKENNIYQEELNKKINLLLENKNQRERNWNNLVINKNKKIEFNPDENMIKEESDLTNNLNQLREDKLQKEKEWNNLVINKTKNIELNKNENISKISELNERLNKLSEKNTKKEKEWNNLIINKNKNIEINENENLLKVLESNEKLKKLAEKNLQKEKEWNNLAINKSKNIEINESDNILKVLELNKKLYKIEEKNDKKEKEWINLSINKNKNIEINESENILKVLESNEKLSKIAEKNTQKEKEWNNLTINKNQDIEIDESKNILKVLELNKNLSKISEKNEQKEKKWNNLSINKNKDIEIDESENILKVLESNEKLNKIAEKNLQKEKEWNNLVINKNKNIQIDESENILKVLKSNEKLNKIAEKNNQKEKEWNNLIINKNKNIEIDESENLSKVLESNEKLNKLINKDIQKEKEWNNLIINKNKNIEINENENLLKILESKEKLNKITEKNIQKEKEWNNLVINRNKNIGIDESENISKISELNDKLNKLKEKNIKKEKDWNNLVINKNKNIGLNEDESILKLLESNEKLNKLMQEKVKKEKEWNNLVINRNKNIEINENENLLKVLESNEKLNKLLEKNIQKEKDWNNLVINKNKNIEINESQNISELKEKLNKLIEKNVKKEKDRNNLFINKTRNIEIDESENISELKDKLNKLIERNVQKEKGWNNLVINRNKNIDVDESDNISNLKGKLNKLIEKNLQKEKDWNNLFINKNKNIEINESENISELKEKLNKLIERNTQKEKSWNNLVINKNKNIELNQNYIKSKISELNEKLNKLTEKNIQKEKEWNNLVINKNKNIELNEDENKSKDPALSRNSNSLIEDKIQRDKEWKNLVINKIKKIELGQNENIDINDLDLLLKSNKNIKSLLKEILKKENKKDNDNNLIINKIKTIELKSNKNKKFEKECQSISKELNIEIKEKNKTENIFIPILNEEFTLININKPEKFDIQSFTIDIDKEEKVPIVYNEDKNIQIIIEGKNKPENYLIKNMMTNENQIYIKRTKKLGKTVLNKGKDLEKDKVPSNEDILLDENQQKLRNIQKKPLIDNNVDNCIQFNIDRIYENKNNLLKDENKVDKLKKEEIEISKPKEETLISKNDDVNIEGENKPPHEREIKISTKKVYRKNIHHTFKKISIESGNNLSIKAIEKEKPIFEKESQDNNRFSIEGTIDQNNKLEKEDVLKNKLINEKESQPKEIIQNIDNCIQFNIDRTYEIKKDEKEPEIKQDKKQIEKEDNEEKEKVEEPLDENKLREKIKLDNLSKLQPEEQNNNRFTVPSSKKPKENIEKENIEKEKEKELLDNKNFEKGDNLDEEDKKELPKENNPLISKNSETSIEGENKAPYEREIKISTKKVYRKSIKRHKFRNISINQGDKLNINGIQKNKIILEKEPQDNTRFTIEQNIKENKEKDNLEQNNEKDEENKNILSNVDNKDNDENKLDANNLLNNNVQRQFIQLEPEKQENNTFTVEKENNLDKSKDKLKLEIIKNDVFNINTIKEEDKTPQKREIKITTKKIYKKNIIHKSYKINSITKENQININGTEKKKSLGEIGPQDNIKFTIEKNIKEQDNKKLEQIQMIDYCVQIHIADSLEEKNILKQFIELKPEEQNNNRFTVIKESNLKDKNSENKISEKEVNISIISSKPKNKLLEICKNEEINLNKEKEREIKISTKKVYRRSIHHKFKIISIGAGDNLTIKAIEKTKPILEEESQDNNRFTILKAEKESKNIPENVNQIEIVNTSDKSSLFEINKNEEININRIEKEEIFTINKNNSINLEGQSQAPPNKEIKITTKKILRKNIKINQFKNNSIISDNQINIEGKEKSFSIKEVSPQENIRFTIEETILENKEEKDMKKEKDKLNEEDNKDQSNKNENDILNQESPSDDLEQQKLKNITKTQLPKDIQDENNLEKIKNIDKDNCIQFNIDRTYDKKDEKEKNKLLLEKINNEEINICRIPKEKISLVTKIDRFSIENNKIIDTNEVSPREIKITTKKVIRKINNIHYKFKNNLITSEKRLNILGKEKTKTPLEAESQENNRFSVGKSFEDEKEDQKENEKENKDNKDNKNELDNEKKYNKLENKDIDNKEDSEHKQAEIDKSLLRAKKLVKSEELKIVQPISYNISQDEDTIKEKINELISINKQENLNKSLEIIRNEELKLIPTELKREIKITTKKVLKKKSIKQSKFINIKAVISPQNQFDIKGIGLEDKLLKINKNNEIKNENNILINSIGKKFDNIILPNKEDKNNNRFSIEKDSKNILLNKLKHIEPDFNISLQIFKIEEKPFEILKINSININNENDLDGLSKKQIQKLKKIEGVHRNQENVINIKSQFTIKGKPKKATENIINNMAKFSINKISKKPVINIINTKSQFTINGVNKKINKNNIINTKSQFILNGQNRKNKENIITTKTQFIIKGINKNQENQNIINTKSQFTINGSNKKSEKNIINIKSQFTIEGIQKEVKEEGIQIVEKKQKKLEKTTDTSDLIPKEIKITTKKVIRTTNILKSKFDITKNIICPEKQINIIGNEKQIKENGFNKDKLFEDIQQNKFIIKNISNKELKDKIKQKINGELTTQNFELNIERKEETNLMKKNILEKENQDDKDWNKILKEDIQQNKFIIKKNKKILRNKKDIKDDKNIINQNKNNIIVKKININIKGDENQKDKLINKLLSEKQSLRNEEWNKSLKEDIQQNKFIIKRISKNIYSKFTQLENDKKIEKNIDEIKDNKQEDNKDNENMIKGKKEISYKKIKYEQNEENKRDLDWNKSLKIDGQQYNFLIKRISKNIYSKLNKVKDLKDEDKEKIKEDKNKEEQTSDKDKQIKNWNEILKEDIQQDQFMIESTDKDRQDLLENQNKLKSMKDNIIKDNIIVKKINFNILSTKYNPQSEQSQLLSKEEELSNKNKWINSLKEETQHSKFIIKRIKNKRLKELEDVVEKERINKSKIEIQKNKELNIESANNLPIDKNKIIENWKQTINEDKSEELNIEKQPKKKEIKITTKKILKTTNNIFHRFNQKDLIISNNDLYIEEQPKNKIQEYSIETNQINKDIPKSYPSKPENELLIEKNKEIAINPEEKIKKEIKIRTKRTISKTNYVYKRFTTNFITKENELNIKGKKSKNITFNPKKLEKNDILENNFTIDKDEAITNKKEEEMKLKLKDELDNQIKEIKEKLQKESDDKLKEDIEKLTEELEKKLLKENEEVKDKLIKENDELKNKIKKEADEQLQERINKEIEELKIEVKNEEEKLKDKYNKENEELKNKLIKENEEMKEKLEKEKNDEKNKFEKENNDLKRENEELKTKLDNEEITRKEEYNNKLKNNKPILNEGFTINNTYITQNKNKNLYSIEQIQLSIDQLQKSSKELTESGEDNKSSLKEKSLEIKNINKKEIKITTKKVLKKIIKPSFKHTFICPDNSLKIITPNNILKQKKNIINKIKSFSINKTDIKDKEKEKYLLGSKLHNINKLEIKKNENIIIKKAKNKNLGNSIIINKVSNIQLFNDKMHQPNNITEKTFGDKIQLNDDKMQKSIIELTDPHKNVYEMLNTQNKNVSETDKSASKIEEGDAKKEDGKIYSIRKVVKKAKKDKKSKNKKFRTLVIDLDNKIDLQKCFNKWNNKTPNLFGENEKNKVINIKQIDKGKNINDNKDNKDNNNEALKNENMNKTNDNDLNNINKNEQLITKKLEDSNINNINIEQDQEKDIINKNLTESDNNINEKQTKTDKPAESDTNTNNIDSKNKIDEKNKNKGILNIENKQKIEVPKKREIIINKRVTIISKKKPKIKYEDIKSKFIQKRFLIKFWKVWKKKLLQKKEEKEEEQNIKNEKDNNILEKENEDKKIEEEEKTDTKNLERINSNKKPFILKINKVSIKKRILEIPKTKIVTNKNNEIQEKIMLLRNKIIGKNKALFIKNFFNKWKKETKNESNIIIGTNKLQIILRRYIVRYLIMHGKILKFKKLLIKYALNKNK